MEANEEEKRLKIKKQVNHILEPLVIDLLITKPTEPLQFMREWLEKRREYFENYPSELFSSDGGSSSRHYLFTLPKGRQPTEPQSER